MIGTCEDFGNIGFTGFLIAECIALSVTLNAQRLTQGVVELEPYRQQSEPVRISGILVLSDF